MTTDHYMFDKFPMALRAYADADTHNPSSQAPSAACFQVQNVTSASPTTPESIRNRLMTLVMKLGAAEKKLGIAEMKIETLEDKVSAHRAEMDQLKLFLATLTSHADASSTEIPRSTPAFATSGVYHISSDGPKVPSLTTDSLSRQASFEPKTPKTPKTPRMGALPPVTPTNALSSRRRHVRTKTPEQRSLQKVMKGQKLYTVGLEPQQDRGLIADFFDEIHRWALHSNIQYELTDENIAVIAELPVVKSILSGNNIEEVRAIVADDNMRVELVAAIVAKDIVYNTMCDHFLFNSGHPDAGACDYLFNEYVQLSQDDFVEKHDVLVQQKTLYTSIHGDWKFHQWRDQVAEEKSRALIEKLDPLVSDQATATGLEGILAHYIKGYRIGFRMRMDAMKWVMFWPDGGADFNPGAMVNESRNICGSANDTNKKTSQFPQNFTVRFARSPLMTKTDFSWGREDKQIIHSACVQIKEKQCYVGAEAERKRSNPLLRNGNGNGNGGWA